MHETKTIEIRDRMTFIPAVATRICLSGDAKIDYPLRRVGVSALTVLTKLTSNESHANWFDWSTDTRTMPLAHQWLENNWDKIKSGDVLDVEFINGESAEPKKSERLCG